jgi:hypothetical protein
VRQVDGGRAFLAGIAIGAVMMSAVGLVASGLIKSPLQVAAETAPPSPSVITATARWQVLENTIFLRGVVTAARTIDVTAAAPYSEVIVTRMPVTAGQRVRPGQVVAQIDGRPILVLYGILPAYRNLHEGDAGPDVGQLQHALERLGYIDFDSPGLFGPSTALALLLLYRHLGYAPPLYRPAPVPGASEPTGPRLPGAGRQPAKARLRIPSAYLPMSEVVFIPARSALVVSVNAKVGTVVTTGPVLRLATGDPTVNGLLGPNQARQVRAGMAAWISSARPRLFTHGVVTHVGSFPLPARQPGQGFPVVITGLRLFRQQLIGTRVRVTLWLAATSGPVLAVPLAAVITAHGSASVIRLAAGRRISVAVRTGISADGLVAVRPVLAGALKPGDRVVLGVGR